MGIKDIEIDPSKFKEFVPPSVPLWVTDPRVKRYLARHGLRVYWQVDDDDEHPIIIIEGK